jgi:hypothetical protein
MKIAMQLSTVTVVLLWCSCMVAVNKPDDPPDSDHSAHPVFTRTTSTCFPFQDNSNWWQYAEAGGNNAAIYVTDTISDDDVLYYRVSFMENRVDTTNDWFLRSNSGIYFGQSLTGNYNLFLPAKIDSAAGSFSSAGSTVSYRYYDSLSIDGVLFHRVLHACYSMPVLHGFDEITFVDSIGIVQLIDYNGRWPITYTIDSCSVSGVIRRFR